MAFAPLSCAVCGLPIPETAIDEALAAAECPACHTLYDLSAHVGAASPQNESRPRRTRVPAPTGFEVDEAPGKLTVRWRWYHPSIWVLAVIAAGWNTLITYGARGTWQGPELVPRIVMLFPVAIGLALAYLTLGGLLNSTLVTVTQRRLRIHRGPLPWPWQTDMDGSELKQLFVRNVVTVNTETESNGHRRTVKSTTYQLCAIDRVGKERTIMQSLSSANDALWLEEMMERYLGIEDRPIEGELKP